MAAPSQKTLRLRPPRPGFGADRGGFGFGPRLAPRADVVELFLGQALDADEHVLRRTRPDQFVEPAWIAAPSRFRVFWIRNAIRKVTMVVQGQKSFHGTLRVAARHLTCPGTAPEASSAR